MKQPPLIARRDMLALLSILAGAALTAPLHGATTTVATGEPTNSIPGVTYRHDVVRTVPWSIHIVKLDRTNAEFQPHSVLANGREFGLTPLTDQLTRLPADLGRPVAAINGDFYDDDSPYQGDPKGLQIVRGELFSSPGPWTCLWMDAENQPHTGLVASRFAVTWPNGEITPLGLNERRPLGTAVLYTRAIGASTRTRGGRELVLEKCAESDWLPLKIGNEYTFRIREARETGNTPLAADSMVLSLGTELRRKVPKLEAGMTVKVSTATSPDLKGATNAIGGGPALVHAGKAQMNDSHQRHPRAAIGWNKDSFFLVSVDGRQSKVSVGMTYDELAKYMADLGCEEALNLDGGGSVTLWMGGQVVNHPSEGKERGVANSIVFFQRPKS